MCGDATELIPPEGRVFYLFNPFDETVMERFAAGLRERGRPATVVYYNAKFLEPFREGLHGAGAGRSGARTPFGGADAGVSPVRRRRTRITIHVSANATDETSTAAPAPVTPHSFPSTTISGSITTVSTPCAHSRSPGRPIVTGKVFVQLSTSWIAPATQDQAGRRHRGQVLPADDDANEERHQDPHAGISASAAAPAEPFT